MRKSVSLIRPAKFCKQWIFTSMYIGLAIPCSQPTRLRRMERSIR